MNGWLTPEGEYIPCEPYQHEIIARLYGGSELQWERQGYVKVFNDRYYCERFLTDAQEKWLTDNNCL